MPQKLLKSLPSQNRSQFSHFAYGEKIEIHLKKNKFISFTLPLHIKIIHENVESTVQNLKFYYTLEKRTLRHNTLQMVSVLIVAYDNLFWPETFFDFRAGTKINL